MKKNYTVLFLTLLMAVFSYGQVSVTVSDQNNVSCNGGSDGSISITVSGGTPGY
jgi:hypothetical protein